MLERMVGAATSALSARGYRLLGVLGEGGMARVYLGVSRKTAGFAKLVVLKVLRTNVEEPDLERMFLAEARIAALLNHPNVVQTYEADNAEGHPFLAMEYLEGRPLSALRVPAAEGLVTPAFELRIIADALRGLHYAHELKDVDGTPLEIVHRDVSPQNVFVTFDGVTKIVDFGIAKLSGAPNTESGIIKGKVGYIAPEQVRGEKSDRRADVFAAGVMIWEALAGRRLVRREDDDTAALMRRMKGEDPSIRKIAPDVAPDIAKICDKAMSPLADDRYPTALALSEELESWLRVHEGPDAKNIASVLETLFGEDRQRTKALIAEQLKDEDAPLIRFDDDKNRPVTISAPIPPGTTTSGAHVTELSVRAAPPRRSRKLLTLGIGVVAAGVIGVIGRSYLVPSRSAPLDVSCVGNVTWIPEDPVARVKSKIRFVDFARRPVRGVVVEVCAQLDPECTKPLAELPPSDATGHVIVEVPKAFRGTLQIRKPPPSIDDMMKTIIYMVPLQLEDDRLDLDTPITRSAVLFSRTELNALMLTGRVGKLDPARGHILAAAEDCSQHPLPGVHIQPSRIDADTVTFYGTSSDMPSVVAPPAGETAGSAQFGFLNLSPGPITLEATMPSKNLRVGTLDLLVRPDYVITTLFPPTP